MAANRARFGEAVVDTALEVLAERLGETPEPPTAADGGLAGEQRKQVTILFASIGGFTRLSGAARNTERLQQIDLLWRQLDETIHAHGGIVDKHMGDVIMGIFGAPLSREDDPERAVRCALALRELVSDFLHVEQPHQERDAAERSPVILRIGINTGQVSLGQVGSDVGQTAIGDAVNVASRLKDTTAESGIYIAQDTYRLVRHLFRFEPLGELAMKGRQTPVTVYRVLGSRPRLFFPSTEGVEGVHVPMIGRETELSALQDAMRRAAQDGHGGLVVVAGEAGIGKSRLMREFHRWLESFPIKATLFQARTDQRLIQAPYSLLRDLLLRHFNIDESDRPATAEGKIVKGLAEVLPDGRRATRQGGMRARARAIGSLLGLGLPASPLAPAAGPEGGAGVGTGREGAIESIVEYFGAVARRSAVTLVFLEDVHWADEDSLTVLERVSAIGADAPLLLIATARPLLYERRPGWPGEGFGPAVRLTLPPLSEADSHDLVLSILRKLPQIPPALSALIVRLAAGNPFYVEEMVRVLIEDGVIVPDEAGWQLRPRELTRLRVPATLTGILQARLDRLPELERVTLQQAAVVGDEFWAGAVHQINEAARHPFPPEQVDAALQALERRDMIYRASNSMAGSLTYLFKHTVLREVAYESVLLRDRPGYHLLAARWLESRSGEWAVEYSALIAQHHELAGRPAEAARLYEQAAARAGEQFKLGSAIDYYRKVLELVRPLPQHLDTRLRVEERQGHFLVQRGRLVEAMAAYRSMHDAAALDGNLLAQARALIAQAAIYLEWGDWARACGAAAQAEQLARLTGAELESARALLLQGEGAGRLERWPEAIDSLWQGVERARALDAPRETARGLAALAHLYARRADTAATAEAVAELSALIDQLAQREHPDEAEALVQLARLLSQSGQYAEAQRLLTRALRLQRAAGRPGAEAETLRLLGLAVCRAGDGAAAMDYLEESAAQAEATGGRYLRLRCRLAIGEALLANSQYPAAEATLRQVIAAAEDRQRFEDWVDLPHAYSLLVEVLRRQGRRDEAQLIVERREKKK